MGCQSDGCAKHPAPCRRAGAHLGVLGPASCRESEGGLRLGELEEQPFPDAEGPHGNQPDEQAAHRAPTSPGWWLLVQADRVKMCPPHMQLKKPLMGCLWAGAQRRGGGQEHQAGQGAGPQGAGPAVLRRRRGGQAQTGWPGALLPLTACLTGRCFWDTVCCQLHTLEDFQPVRTGYAHTRFDSLSWRNS